MFFKHILNFCLLICVLCFCLVACLSFLVLFVLFVFFVNTKSFRKKNEKFKTALITSFILLLTYYVFEMRNDFHPTTSPRRKKHISSSSQNPPVRAWAPPDHLTSGKYNLNFLSKNKTNRIIAAHRSHYRSFHLLSSLFFTFMDISSTRKAISKLWEDTRWQHFTGVVSPPPE